jgi:hypothetical protein
MGWLHPSEVENYTAGFLTLIENFDAHTASIEEITYANWESLFRIVSRHKVANDYVS